MPVNHIALYVNVQSNGSFQGRLGLVGVKGKIGDTGLPGPNGKSGDIGEKGDKVRSIYDLVHVQSSTNSLNDPGSNPDAIINIYILLLLLFIHSLCATYVHFAWSINKTLVK